MRYVLATAQCDKPRHPVRQFSPPHLAALAVLLVASILSVWAARRNWVGPAYCRLLALLIFAAWAGEYVADGLNGTYAVKYTLPLQLTDVISVTAIIALWTRRRLAVELLYFWSLSASLQALVNPGPRGELPEPLLLHLLRLPRRVGRGRADVGLRPAHLSAPEGGAEGLRHHAGVGGGSRDRRRRDERQLHVPARQADSQLLAQRHGPMALVHRHHCRAGSGDAACTATHRRPDSPPRSPRGRAVSRDA